MPTFLSSRSKSGIAEASTANNWITAELDERYYSPDEVQSLMSELTGRRGGRHRGCTHAGREAHGTIGA